MKYELIENYQSKSSIVKSQCSIMKCGRATVAEAALPPFQRIRSTAPNAGDEFVIRRLDREDVPREAVSREGEAGEWAADLEKRRVEEPTLADGLAGVNECSRS